MRTLSRVCLMVGCAAGCRGTQLSMNGSCDWSAPLELAAVRRDSLAPSGAKSPDDSWARIARATPGGFAGVYFEQVARDPQGQPTRRPRVVIRLVRPSEAGVALHALLPVLPATFGGLAIDSADVLVIPATWDFAQIVEWRRYLDTQIHSVELVSVDNDEVANQIHYEVASAKARSAFERRLGELRVPCGLVAIDVAKGWPSF